MPKFALDTNVYVDALRQADAFEALGAFVTANAPAIHLSAVVLHEILAGARSAMHAEELEVHLGEPYLRTGRVFAPTTAAWRRSGAIIASLRRSGGRIPDAALVNDVLLALSCREKGVTLVTRDRDLWQIEPHVRGLQLAAPFP